jgi:hypothetical protein
MVLPLASRPAPSRSLSTGSIVLKFLVDLKPNFLPSFPPNDLSSKTFVAESICKYRDIIFPTLQTLIHLVFRNDFCYCQLLSLSQQTRAQESTLLRNTDCHPLVVNYSRHTVRDSIAAVHCAALWRFKDLAGQAIFEYQIHGFWGRLCHQTVCTSVPLGDYSLYRTVPLRPQWSDHSHEKPMCCNTNSNYRRRRYLLHYNLALIPCLQGMRLGVLTIDPECM